MKKLLIPFLSVFLILCGCSQQQEQAQVREEEKTEKTDDIFDTSYVHEINVEISEDDWNDLKENPLDKTKYEVNVTIDGETVSHVSFATKGNTSLSSVASDPDSDRYSFKLNFGKFEKGQTFQGLKKLNLNNIYADATYMKDYLSYQMFNEAGALSSRCSYVWLKINGEDFGLYTAIEEVDQSFLDMNTDSAGSLYKPESESLDNMGNPGEFRPDGMEMPEGQTPPDGQRPDMPEGFDPSQGGFPQQPGNGMTPPDMQGNGQPPQMPENSNPFQPFPGQSENGQPPEMPDGQMPEGGGFQPGDGTEMPPQWNMGGGPGGFSDSSGASLVYTDDELSSYSDIFDNAETDVTEEDEMRVIAALKQLSEGDAENCIDIENTVKYFAVHNFVLNYDSYTGNMLHNYYLYENDGKLTMIPWDYNLAYGAFAMGNRNDATSLINSGIDSPLSAADDSQRPMWAWIAGDDTYKEKYHEVFADLLSSYFESGKFEKEFDRVVSMLRPYVEKDPSAFYTAEEFDQASSALKQFCLLRAQSIRKQLDGTLSSVTSQQNAADRVNASLLNIDSMGSFQGGGPGKREF